MGFSLKEWLVGRSGHAGLASQIIYKPVAGCRTAVLAVPGQVEAPAGTAAAGPGKARQPDQLFGIVVILAWKVSDDAVRTRRLTPPCFLSPI